MKNSLQSILISATVVTMVCLIIYITVQQAYRSNANDPQVQMAEDAANQMMSGISAEMLCNGKKIDVASSISPFLNIYNEAGDPVAGNGILNGIVASIPKGVFETAKTNGKHEVTWQPRKGVRSALVIYYFNSNVTGYAVSGRSLRESEKRVESLINQLLFGWLVSIVIIAAVTILSHLFFEKKKD